VDQITFIWNTLLLLVTNFYVITQECFREGVRWTLEPPLDCRGFCWEWHRRLIQSISIENEIGSNLVSVMVSQIVLLYILGEIGNVLGPAIFNWVALRLVFVANVGGSHDSPFQRALRSILPKFKNLEAVTSREAERAQILAPLLLWMEYTYIVIFPAMAFLTLYLMTDTQNTVCLSLLAFSVIFYLWQRYIMMWLYGKSTFDSSANYEAFIHFWGLVVSLPLPTTVWWAYRRGAIQEQSLAFLTMALVFVLSLLIYEIGLYLTEAMISSSDEDGIDSFADGVDPGYEHVMDTTRASWWNRNPVYVLKNRHCPEQAGHEVHEPGVRCWPILHARQGYYELGKSFRHQPPPREKDSKVKDLEQGGNGHGNEAGRNRQEEGQATVEETRAEVISFLPKPAKHIVEKSDAKGLTSSETVVPGPANRQNTAEEVERNRAKPVEACEEDTGAVVASVPGEATTVEEHPVEETLDLNVSVPDALSSVDIAVERHVTSIAPSSAASVASGTATPQGGSPSSVATGNAAALEAVGADDEKPTRRVQVARTTRVRGGVLQERGIQPLAIRSGGSSRLTPGGWGQAQRVLASPGRPNGSGGGQSQSQRTSPRSRGTNPAVEQRETRHSEQQQQQQSSSGTADSRNTLTQPTANPGMRRLSGGSSSSRNSFPTTQPRSGK